MEYIDYLKKRTKEIIEGSIVEADDGTFLYTPDGFGHYHALWTRDYAYMVEYASEFIPLCNQKKCIEYLIDGARKEDGWIPDRVDENKKAFHTAGVNFPALPNLDNGPFLVIAADCYLSALDESKAKIQFEIWKEKLCAGIDCLPLDSNGFVVNETTPPHSPYGFTDCICKTGKLSMETLILWKAVKALNKYDAGEKYKKMQKSIEENFAKTFSADNGMIYSATKTAHQIDIWASCYAVSIGFPLSREQTKKIADFLIDNYEKIVLSGQIRHLIKGEYWEKTIFPVEKETYQNGAYWATASGWFYEAIAEYYPKKANETIKEAIEFFINDGIFECINEGYRQLDTYVASITNVYGVYLKHF